jgi:predicted nucleic acid-binding protein
MKNTTNKPSILIDLNILLDVFQKRERFFENSARVLALIESGFVKGFVSAHIVMTLYYLFQKGRSTADAKAAITNLLKFLLVAPINQETIEQALNLEMNDFEDAVQMIAAIHWLMNLSLVFMYLVQQIQNSNLYF